MNALIRRYSLGLGLALLSVAPLQITFAATDKARWYQLEIIAFEAKDKTRYDSEQWPPEPGVASTENSLPVLTMVGDHTQESVLPVEEEAYQLNDIAKRLIKSTDYNVLFHTAWRQPVVQHAKAVSIYIDDLMFSNPEAEPVRVNTQDLSSDQLFQTALREEEAELHNAEHGEIVHNARIFGTVTLRWTRYTHLDVDFTLRSMIGEPEPKAISVNQLFPMLMNKLNPSEEDVPEEVNKLNPNVVKSFRLKESERVRSDRLYYIDHPLFGIIAMLTPYELPVVEAPEAEQPISIVPPPVKPKPLAP